MTMIASLSAQSRREKKEIASAEEKVKELEEKLYI